MNGYKIRQFRVSLISDVQQLLGSDNVVLQGQ